MSAEQKDRLGRRNLDKLSRATDGLAKHQRDAVYQFVLGWCAAYVSEDGWDAALRNAPYIGEPIEGDSNQGGQPNARP